MGDLIRVRLTGLFRDEEPDTYDKDPGCEAQFEDLDDPTVLKTARVVFANNCPCPWYAVMAHFYGTVKCTTGTMTVPDIGTYRTYQVNAQDAEAIVTALAIRSADDTGTVCLEIPADAVFHGIVMGRTQPEFGDENLPTAADVMTWGSWGSLPVPAGSWCRLIFVAADGSNYGTEVDPDGRWVFGFYPTTSDNSGLPSSSSLTQARVNDAMPVLQFGANVTLMARRYDERANIGLFETRISWHVVPGETAPGTLIIARKGTDDFGLAYEEFDASQTYDQPCIVAWDDVRLMWRKATVTPSAPKPADPDNSARSDRTVLGVCIGSNGSNGSVSLAQRFLALEGKFWLSPSLHPLLDNTPYYISSDASELSPPTQGVWSADPCTKGCKRVAFFHHTNGWCTVGPQYSAATGTSTTVTSIAKVTAQDPSLTELVVCELYPHGRTTEGGDLTWSDVPVQILQIRAGSDKLPVGTWLLVVGTLKVPAPDPMADDYTDFNWYAQPPIWI